MARRWLLIGVLLCVVVGCDHASKRLAETRLADQPAVPVVPGVFHLQLARNTDSAFGLLRDYLGDSTRLAVIVTMQGVIILGLLALVARRWRVAARGERVAIGLLLGGAVGNFADRLVRGYVVDFLHVQYWPVFNVADVAICLGVVLFWWASRRSHCET